MEFTQEESLLLIQVLEFARLNGVPTYGELDLVETLIEKILLSKPKKDE